MIYTQKIQEALSLAIKTHELDQKQKRKGKEIPYFAHPFGVGLILSLAGAHEEVIIAGILHDVIEDSSEDNKVSREMIEERFGTNVALYVSDVSETNQGASWDERKHLALLDLDKFSHESLMVKSADLISNNTELLADYEKDGVATFERFNAPKEKTIPHTLEMIDRVLELWDENPLKGDLSSIRLDLAKLI
jgi:(p)ppGpp synthase/HD superfamily hydrolase